MPAIGIFNVQNPLPLLIVATAPPGLEVVIAPKCPEVVGAAPNV